MRSIPSIAVLAFTLLSAAAAPRAKASETESYAVEPEIRVSSDQRNRGVSDSLGGPGIKLSVQVAHETGLVGVVEIGNVSRKQFLGGEGYNLLLAGGWRSGDPDAWHFGIGAATELFPGAKFDAPHAFDMNAFAPAQVRATRYDSSFAVLELGYGAIEGRLLNVVSRNYRGADTGGVCGTMLALMPDPTRALACYGRGDNNSRGSWLADLGYSYPVVPAITLKFHAGQQKIRHFREADLTDASVGVMLQRWGYRWSADWIATHARVRELYLAMDDGRLRATDGHRLVVSVAHPF